MLLAPHIRRFISEFRWALFFCNSPKHTHTHIVRRAPHFSIRDFFNFAACNILRKHKHTYTAIVVEALKTTRCEWWGDGWLTHKTRHLYVTSNFNAVCVCWLIDNYRVVHNRTVNEYGFWSTRKCDQPVCPISSYVKIYMQLHLPRN